MQGIHRLLVNNFHVYIQVDLYYIWYIDIYMKDGMCAPICIHIYLDTYMDNISVCANGIFTLRLFSGVKRIQYTST